MKQLSVLLLLYIPFLSLAQNRKMFVFDLQNNHVDTIYSEAFDSLIIRDHTDFYVGDYDDEYCDLNQSVPQVNTYPKSNYTKKVQASMLYDINDFPIRTSVKLFKIKNDSLKNKCSGSLISKRHVLTARHCVSGDFSDTLSVKSLFVCPSFDNAEQNLNFECAFVSKIYMFEKKIYSDFCVLELDKPIGQQTGWIGIGFDSDDESLLNGIYYKFSYPATTLLEFDPRPYNGDTLYCGYGSLNVAENCWFGVHSATGIPGESGSSMIKVENKKTYTSYGVMSYAFGLNHSRIQNRDFYPMRSIIKNDVNGNRDDLDKMEEEIWVYPNPTHGPIYLDKTTAPEIKKIVMYAATGKKLFEQYAPHSMDISSFPSGIYFLQIQTDKKSTLIKVIKYSN